MPISDVSMQLLRYMLANSNAWGAQALWAWITDSSTTAIVTWVGTILGLIGICFTFGQARAAKTAARSALDAVRALEDKLSVSSIAHSYSQVGIIKDLVQSDDLRAAQIVFHTWKRDILRICHQLKKQSVHTTEIATIQRNVALIEHQLDLGVQVASTYKPQKLTKALSGVSDFLAAREPELTFSSQAS